MSDTEADEPALDRINLRIARPLLESVDETWRERGFNSRSEFIRYALRQAVAHPEGAGFWRDLAISEAQFADGESTSGDELKADYGLEEG